MKILLLFAAVAVLGADDPWTKVREIKSGSEVRVYRKGSKTPVIGKFDQATEDAVVLMLKQEEIGIQREEVDRIDVRPAQNGSRLTRNSTTKTENPAKLPPMGPHRTDDRPDVPTTSNSVSIGSRPDFENVYTWRVGERPVARPQAH